MNVHNIMEDVVIQTVTKLYDELKKEGTSWLTCDCENCRLDTVSYVLNHIPPRYVVSGRGVTHSSEFLADSQVKADIDSAALEGCRIVSATKRPFHALDRKTCEVKEIQTPTFNFPVFTGTVIDGSNFEPVIGATVILKYKGNPVEMIDKTFSNPCITCQSTKGAYTFWVKPFECEKAGVSEKFNFSIEVSAPDYDKQIINFDVTLTSDPYSKNQLDSTFSIKKDIVIFNTEIENTMDD